MSNVPHIERPEGYRAVPIRMSSAGYCPLRQYLAATQQPGNGETSRQVVNMMALGDAAEDILIRNMVADGWEVTDTRVMPGEAQLRLQIEQPLPMTGHPDGICRHPVHTRNLWVTLECKSMSAYRLAQVKEQGIAAVYPQYLAQVICYSRILYEMGRVAHPHKAVFVYMGRDGEQPAPERVSWTLAEEEQLWERLGTVWGQVLQQQEITPPYAWDSSECEYCPYFTRCHQQPRPTQYDRPVLTVDPELEMVAQQWVDANELRRQAAARLRQAVPSPYTPGIAVGPVEALWFWPNATDQYDPSLLERMVPSDVLRQCRRQDAKGPAFWIRRRRI